ncbi:hypothetical protein EVAR_50662_1 [Eumeta japonica]|uniref:Uncharacterized protein n=1 Tax=Eumeta variegata TaxID=151549 RepID=A0A4C1XNC5_EUMVA|nr:hypothetical protein EVAR_50662_1 [Eumeta japonica]
MRRMHNIPANRASRRKAPERRTKAAMYRARVFRHRACLLNRAAARAHTDTRARTQSRTGDVATSPHPFIFSLKMWRCYGRPSRARGRRAGGSGTGRRGPRNQYPHDTKRCFILVESRGDISARLYASRYWLSRAIQMDV